MTQDNREKENIKEFIDKYGIKGFYTLFLTNYFNEIITSEIKSYIDSRYTKNDPKKDSIYMFYKDKNSKFNFSEIKKYEDEMYNKCRILSEKLVEDLSKNKDLSILFENDLDIKNIKNEKKIKLSLDNIILEYINKIKIDE